MLTAGAQICMLTEACCAGRARADTRLCSILSPEGLVSTTDCSRPPLGPSADCTIPLTVGLSVSTSEATIKHSIGCRKLTKAAEGLGEAGQRGRSTGSVCGASGAPRRLHQRR